MEEPLISFETAKLLKEMEIIIDGFHHYNENGTLLENSVSFKDHVAAHHLYANTYDFEIDRWGGGNKKCIAAPTQSLLQKWLRDEHKICVECNILLNGSYTYSIYRLLKGSKYTEYLKLVGTKQPIYEVALEQGLVEGLKLIKK